MPSTASFRSKQRSGRLGIPRREGISLEPFTCRELGVAIQAMKEQRKLSHTSVAYHVSVHDGDEPPAIFAGAPTCFMWSVFYVVLQALSVLDSHYLGV